MVRTGPPSFSQSGSRQCLPSKRLALKQLLLLPLPLLVPVVLSVTVRIPKLSLLPPGKLLHKSCLLLLVHPAAAVAEQ
jgi:hypothetical protein